MSNSAYYSFGIRIWAFDIAHAKTSVHLFPAPDSAVFASHLYYHARFLSGGFKKKLTSAI